VAPTHRNGIRVSPSYIADHPEADPTRTELVMNLLVAASNILASMDDLLRPLGLTTSAFNVLQIVAGDPEPLSPSEITARFPIPITTATMTGLLDTCERHGWLVRRPHPSDRRRVLIEMTDAGRAVRADAERLVIRAEHEWTAPTTEASRIRTTSVLGGLVDHLRASRAS
jgi:DNA-binding MarR family transcriptional regulator